MTTVPRIHIDLDAPAGRRMAAFSAEIPAIRTLAALYVGPHAAALDAEAIEGLAATWLTADERAELRALAALTGLSFVEIALVNAHYDVASAAFGCTAVAVDTPVGPWHARNLDWANVEGRLSAETRILEFHRGGRLHFATVGWPGFVAALSGVSPGRFAVTLNAAVSDERPAPARPVSFLLREVLDTAPDFDAAVAVLHDTPILADCLLLVTGARPGQLTVIERTPTRAARREAVAGRLVVTNGYRALDAHEVDFGALGATACSRFAVAQRRLEAIAEPTPAALRQVLDDPGVRWELTAQQMVFHAASGANDAWPA